MRKLAYIRNQFRHQAGYEPDLLSPRTFNEKLQWLKLFHHDPLHIRITDKISAKGFVEERVGATHVIPTLGVFDDAGAFDPASWPVPYVLKLNSGSGEVLFCRQHVEIDAASTRAMIAEWLRPERNHFNFSAEWSYRDIVSRILVEPMIASPEDIIDYKVFCFGGEPRLIMPCTERTSGLKVDFFDTDWNHLPFTRHYPNAATCHARPDVLPELIRLARVLSAGFVFLRVDFYITTGRVLVGELTLYPGNGMEPFSPFDWDRRIGDWINLPELAVILPRPPAHPVRLSRTDLATLLADLDDFRALPDTPCPPPAPNPDQALIAEVSRLSDKVIRMQRSFSWRVTAPLRALRRSIERLR